MQRIDFGTTLGTVALWGRFDAFVPNRPLLLVIRGILGEPDQLLSLADRLPEADVVLAHLPGMHTPRIALDSAVAVAAAFDEVIGSLGRRLVVLGVSLGGTIAFRLRSPLIDRMIVLDPPLDTASLRPLAGDLRAIAANSDQEANWVKDMTGFLPVGEAPLDFRPLTDGLSIPCLALLGSELGCVDRMPSLVSLGDRELLEHHSAITTRIVVGVGHNIPRDGLGAMMWAVRLAIGALSIKISAETLPSS